jgi:IS5 family transposase
LSPRPLIFNKAYDKEAIYTLKRGQKHHGYKMHIATDTNGVIKKVIATTASTHDSTQFDTLTEDETKAIFADSGYVSKERKKRLRKKVSLMVLLKEELEDNLN